MTLTTKYLFITLVLFVSLRQLAAYPDPSGYRYINPGYVPPNSVSQLAEANSEWKARNSDREAAARYQYRYPEPKYYNLYNKKELQAAENALILDRIAEITAKGVPTPPPGTASCLVSGQTTFTEATMDKLLWTVKGTLNELLITDTIIMTGDATVISENQNCLSSFQSFVGSLTSSLPTHIWMNFAPPPDCLHEIVYQYKDVAAPTLHIANIRPADVLEMIKSFECYAVVLRKNFQIISWDWNTFKTGLALTTTCQDKITTATVKPEFISIQERVGAAVKYAEDISNVPNLIIDNWCPTPVNLSNHRM